jgi:GT2 family glycosyltransferase
MELPLVFTVIPNWNLKNDLKDCIASLLQGQDAAHQIVVVDNGSSDGSVEMVKGEFPQVHLLEQAENLGYAGALNTGFRFALGHGAGYLFGLNNDTVLPAGSVRRLVERAAAHPEIGLLSPKVVYYSDPGRLFSLGGRAYPWLPLPLEFGHRWRDDARYNRLIYYDYVTGCAMLVPAEVLRRVGLLDTSYFIHYEDNDFCRRIRDCGWRIAMDGQVTILHKAFQSTRRDPAASIRRQARNRIWFYRRYPHGPHPGLTRLALYGIAYFKVAQYILTNRRAQAQTYLDGFREGWKNPLPQPEDTELAPQV